MKNNFLIISFFLAHATYANSESTQENSNTSSYEDFLHSIAGSGALNCGFIDFNASSRQRTKVKKCAKRVVDRGIPYKFGYAAFGEDSAYYMVAIRDKNGKLWSIQYDLDVIGGAGKSAKPAIWVFQCKKIFFRPGTSWKGSFFDHENCEEDKEIIANILSLKK